ncbi:MAG: hypothetical protein GXO39_05115 [Thermotogae bacterium]|nr:hypothetical protein [Thermotogota bacterium]
MESWRKSLDKFALQIHSMGLGSVAIFMLESMKPLSNLILNLGVFTRPILDVIVPEDLYDTLLDIARDREKVEYLITKLEELEDGILVTDGTD